MKTETLRDMARQAEALASNAALWHVPPKPLDLEGGTQWERRYATHLRLFGKRVKPVDRIEAMAANSRLDGARLDLSKPADRAKAAAAGRGVPQTWEWGGMDPLAGENAAFRFDAITLKWKAVKVSLCVAGYGSAAEVVQREIDNARAEIVGRGPNKRAAPCSSRISTVGHKTPCAK